MKKTVRAVLIVLFLLFAARGELNAQEAYKVHSHNDYDQNIPFWKALSAEATSIEADVFMKNGTLYVAHGPGELSEGRTLENLYIKPLTQAVASGYLTDSEMQLLIDIKSEAYTTLDGIVALLKKYPGLIENPDLRFIISGNRPETLDYINYPGYIWFDHQNPDELNTIPLEKVALISVSFKDYSAWNGYGRMTAPDLKAVKAVIEKAKNSNKPFRFWASPDTQTAWARLAKLGVDFINTDKPVLTKQYLDKLDENTFKKELPIEVYQPKYEYDANSNPQNVILMIGDGNGLAQISAAMIANRGNLTLTGIKDIGLVKTASYDDLITDSAAGATAMATGSKTNNRAIGTDANGKALTSLIDIAGKQGFNMAIVTTDAIYGATPAAFFAHRIERDDTEGLVEDLIQSKLNFFIAGGEMKEDIIKDVFTTEKMEAFDTFQEPTAIYLGASKAPSVINGRKNALPLSVKTALGALNRKKEPFFLLVEAAQIDSGGHSNSTSDIIEEMLDFDRAIAEALHFADTDKNTLVIITADHETSGFGIVGGDQGEGTVHGDFLTVDHTGIMVPLFAYGPYSDQFRGVYENTQVFNKVLEALEVTVKE